MSKQSEKKTKRQAEKTYKVTLWIPDQKSLTEVLASAKTQVSCTTAQRENDGTYRVELYASPAESKKISELGYRHEIDTSYTEVLMARQKEVSKIDRFKGGKVKPTGLGERR
jgi:hypothetical protein